MIPDRFILVRDSTPATRGEAASVGVEVVKVGERPRAVQLTDAAGAHSAWVMKAGIVRTNQPDILALRPWVQVRGGLREILEGATHA